MPEPGSTTKVAAFDVRGALKEAIARLRAAQVPSHTLAAELLLMYSLGCDRTWLYTNPEKPVDPEVVQAYFALVARAFFVFFLKINFFFQFILYLEH